MSAALRAPGSLLVQPATITAIAVVSHTIGQLCRFSILGVLMDILALLKTAPKSLV